MFHLYRRVTNKNVSFDQHGEARKVEPCGSQESRTMRISMVETTVMKVVMYRMRGISKKCYLPSFAPSLFPWYSPLTSGAKAVETNKTSAGAVLESQVHLNAPLVLPL